MVLRELLAKLSVKVDEAAFSKAKSKLDGLKMGFLKLGGIVSAAAAGLQLLAKETAEAAHEAHNTAKMTGMTTQQVQALGFAAEQSGVSAEEMRHGLIHLARSAMEAKQGSAEAAAGFYQLGVRAVGVDGKVRPMGELLADVTAKIAAMPDGTQKAALAMRLFGRAGAGLIPLFDKGPAGLAKLTAEANRLGVVMSDKLVESGVKYAETLGSLKAAVQGVGYAIMQRLFPAMTKSTAQFREWLVTHRAWIALHVEKAFKVVSDILQSFVRVAKGAIDLFERIWTSGQFGKGVLIALGVAVAALVAPWTLLAATIALVAEDIEMFFSSHGKAKTLTGLLVMAFELLAKKASAIWDGFKTDPFGSLYKWAGDFFTWLEKRATEAVQGVPGKAMASLLKSMGIEPLDLRPDAAQGITHQTAMSDGPAGSYAVRPGGFLRNAFDFAVGDRPDWTRPSMPGGGAAMAGAVTFAPVFNINAPSGDAAEISATALSAFSRFYDERRATELREAHASVNR